MNYFLSCGLVLYGGCRVAYVSVIPRRLIPTLSASLNISLKTLTSVSVVQRAGLYVSHDDFWINVWTQRSTEKSSLRLKNAQSVIKLMSFSNVVDSVRERLNFLVPRVNPKHKQQCSTSTPKHLDFTGHNDVDVQRMHL